MTAGKITTALLGGIFLVGGGALFMAELKGERRPVVLSIAFVVGVLGAGLISPDAIFDRLKRMASVASRFLGRRAITDEHNRPDDSGAAGPG